MMQTSELVRDFNSTTEKCHNVTREPCHVTREQCTRGGEELPKGMVVPTTDLQMRSLAVENESQVGIQSINQSVSQLTYSPAPNPHSQIYETLHQDKFIAKSFQTLQIWWCERERVEVKVFHTAGEVILDIDTHVGALSATQVQKKMAKNLLAMAVGIKQKKVVDQIVQKVR